MLGFGQRISYPAGMGKRRRILVAGLVLAVVGGVAGALFLRLKPEPVYQGKPLSVWLQAYTNPDNLANPERAIQTTTDALSHIGTNAIPTLLRMLRARDSAEVLMLVDLASKQRFIKIHYVSAPLRNHRAAMAFRVLGAKARDAVPALIDIYEENISSESRGYTLFALGGIGPDAKAAVPLMLRAVTDTNAVGRQKQIVRGAAIGALGEIHAEPELVVPALAKVLSEQDEYTRFRAAWALGLFGPAAKSAIPALFTLITNQAADMRANTATAIKKIDPEAAALRKAELDAALAPEKQ